MATPKSEWPEWWNWELECTNPHLTKRMIDRLFNEADLREMLDNAAGFRGDTVPGRFIIETVHAGRAWFVIVEPDEQARILVVVTAFAVG